MAIVCFFRNKSTTSLWLLGAGPPFDSLSFELSRLRAATNSRTTGLFPTRKTGTRRYVPNSHGEKPRRKIFSRRVARLHDCLRTPFQRRVPHPCDFCKGGRRCCMRYLTGYDALRGSTPPLGFFLPVPEPWVPRRREDCAFVEEARVATIALQSQTEYRGATRRVNFP
jgi:hypothetical protein